MNMQSLFDAYVVIRDPIVNATNTEVLVVLISICYFIIGYYTVSPFCKTRRSKSWTLSLFCSIVLSSSGIFYAVQFFYTWGVLGKIPYQFAFSEEAISRFTIYFFQTFLVMDIVIGVMNYKEQIQLLSGWIHHFFYFGLLSWLLYYRYANGLCVFLPLEIPTTVLSLGHMNPEKFRNEILFTLSFFTFRIVYNAALAFVFYQFTQAYSTPAVYIPATAILLVHCYWFYGGIQGLIKKYSQQPKEVSKSADEASNEMSQLHKRKKTANSNEQ